MRAIEVKTEKVTTETEIVFEVTKQEYQTLVAALKLGSYQRDQITQVDYISLYDFHLPGAPPTAYLKVKVID